MEALAHPATLGSGVALGFMLVFAAAIVARRVKPE
jgi:hypothetical protein